jgi:hypothetical protein
MSSTTAKQCLQFNVAEREAIRSNMHEYTNVPYICSMSHDFPGISVGLTEQPTTVISQAASSPTVTSTSGSEVPMTSSTITQQLQAWVMNSQKFA